MNEDRITGQRAGWIEAAARAICEADPLSPVPDAPIMWGTKRAKAWEPRAAIIRFAIDGGLFSHPARMVLVRRHFDAPILGSEADDITAGLEALSEPIVAEWGEVKDRLNLGKEE